jgi:hypothetical protein
MKNGTEVILNWKHLVDAGCRVSFMRTIYDERHDISSTWAYVEHPSKRFEPIQFRATHNCDTSMTARIDDVAHALPFLADLKINFKVQPLSR